MVELWEINSKHYAMESFIFGVKIVQKNRVKLECMFEMLLVARLISCYEFKVLREVRTND